MAPTLWAICRYLTLVRALGHEAVEIKFKDAIIRGGHLQTPVNGNANKKWSMAKTQMYDKSTEARRVGEIFSAERTKFETATTFNINRGKHQVQDERRLQQLKPRGRTITGNVDVIGSEMRAPFSRIVDACNTLEMFSLRSEKFAQTWKKGLNMITEQVQRRIREQSQPPPRSSSENEDAE